MKPNCRSPLFILLTLMLVVILPVPPDVLAQEHVVSSADLHRDLVAAAQARQNNLSKVQKFFSSDQAQKSLASARVPYEKVQKAVSTLSDEELARLAARTDKIQSDFAAGSLTNQQITYIIIALATAVLIIVLIEAR